MQSASPESATRALYVTRYLYPFLCLLIVLAGCRSLRERSEPHDLGLKPEERRFAEALAHYAHGVICEKEFGRRSEEALEQLEKALQLDTKRKRIYLKVAGTYHDQHLLDKAIDILEKACRENPRCTETRKSLAYICQKVGQTDNAIKHYLQVLKLNPSDTDTCLTVAALYFQQEKDSRAINILEKSRGGN